AHFKNNFVSVVHIYVNLVERKQHSIPVMYSLLSNKLERTYKKIIFDYILENCDKVSMFAIRTIWRMPKDFDFFCLL
ncbi:hypothetical protein HZS_120, partial [Henneguya salminicola]